MISGKVLQTNTTSGGFVRLQKNVIKKLFPEKFVYLFQVKDILFASQNLPQRNVGKVYVREITTHGRGRRSHCMLSLRPFYCDEGVVTIEQIGNGAMITFLDEKAKKKYKKFEKKEADGTVRDNRTLPLPMVFREHVGLEKADARGKATLFLDGPVPYIQIERLDPKERLPAYNMVQRNEGNKHVSGKPYQFKYNYCYNIPAAFIHCANIKTGDLMQIVTDEIGLKIYPPNASCDICKKELGTTDARKRGRVCADHLK